LYLHREWVSFSVVLDAVVDDDIIESIYWHLRATVVLVQVLKGGGRGGAERGIQLVAICNLTTRCH